MSSLACLCVLFSNGVVSGFVFSNLPAEKIVDSQRYTLIEVSPPKRATILRQVAGRIDHGPRGYFLALTVRWIVQASEFTIFRQGPTRELFNPYRPTDSAVGIGSPGAAMESLLGSKLAWRFAFSKPPGPAQAFFSGRNGVLEYRSGRINQT
jgi:hypothetical protein